MMLRKRQPAGTQSTKGTVSPAAPQENRHSDAKMNLHRAACPLKPVPGTGQTGEGNAQPPGPARPGQAADRKAACPT